MKRSTLIFALTTFGLGALCLVQWRQMETRKELLATAQSELEQRSHQVENLQTSQKRSRRQAHELADQTEELSAQLQTVKAAENAATAGAANQENQAPSHSEAESETAGGFGGLGKMVSKMLQDPSTKQFIVEQQRLMMDQMYGPLVKKMGLTREETDQFKQLLAENMTRSTEKASSLFSEGPAADRVEVAQSLAADQKDFENQMHELLGDGRYAMYKDYHGHEHDPPVREPGENRQPRDTLNRAQRDA